MEIPRRKPLTRSSSGSAESGSAGLGSFLDAVPKSKTSRGSATVSGDRPLVKNDEEGEIYIRADGKKVRRVKRAVPKSTESTDSASAGLGSFLDSEAKVPTRKASGSATVTGYTPASSKMSSKSSEEGEIYVRPDGKKVRRVKRNISGETSSVASASPPPAAAPSSSQRDGLAGFLDAGTQAKSKMSGSATVTGYTPSKPLKLSAATSLSSSKDDGEIYIRADGKKVRRVKKTTVSPEKGAAATTATAGDVAEPTKEEKKVDKKEDKKDDPAKLSKEERQKKNLENFLNKSSKTSKKTKGSSATVTGADSSKKEKKDLGDFLSAGSKGVKKTKGGAASLSGLPSGGVKLSKSAEDFASKYRKKKKTSASNDTDTKKSASSDDEENISAMVKKPASAGLSGFLGAGETKKPKMSGSATVTGYTPSKKLSTTASAASSADDGEVYIRADGKKVRRVRKASVSKDDTADTSTAAATTPTTSLTEQNGLGSFLDAGVTTKPKMSGSATVTGYNASKGKSTGSKDEGEIYIRPDGKKVRRIRKLKADEEDTVSPALKPASAGLGNFLGNQESIKKPMSGSATVTGAPVSKKSLEGEIYINKDGKKVRRVKKSPALSAAGDLATTNPSTSTPTASPAIKSPEETTPAASSTPGLSGFLDSNLSSKPKMSGSATVTGYTPSKPVKSSASSQEGEIYIRPDGKKVRRIRKPKAADDTAIAAVGSSLPLDASPKPKNGGAATIAGETVIKVTPEGEIVLRADGKKVLRRKKNPGAAAASPDKEGEGEVYRRADGKLVRRVKKGGKSSSAAGDLAGFLDNVRANTPRVSGEIATVAGDARPKTSLGDLMKYKTTEKKQLPELDPNIDLSRLTAEQYAIVGSYRIMLQQGMSAEQVRRRMDQDGVEKIVMSAVLHQDISLSPLRSSNVLGAGPQNALAADTSLAPLGTGDSGSKSVSKLSAEEEALAATYRKMVKMGLPSDAVKHKMVQDGVSKEIIVAVLGEDATSSPEPSPESSDAGKENSPESGLSADEEAIASRFRKMSRMGLPSDAVRHKMEAEGVDPKIIQSVVGDEEESPSSPGDPVSTSAVGSNLSADDEAVASKYRKMFKMGLPEDAVRQKMNMDGVAPHIVASVMGEENSSAGGAEAPAALSTDDEAIASKYRKMFKMGLPEDAVKHKMVQDGVSDHIISAVLNGVESAPALPQPTSVPAPLNPLSAFVPAPKLLSSDDEEIAAKYRKMFKMGLPEDAVRQKMDIDGVEQNIVDAVIQEALGPPPGTVSASVATNATSGDRESKFVVVMGPDLTPTAPPVTVSAPLDPNEKFAVDVEGSGDKQVDSDVETRYMTLQDIAKATGQEPEKLKEMVHSRRRASMTMPRFVLTPVNPNPAGDVFEVAVPKSATASAAAAPAGGVLSLGGPTMKDAGLDPSKNYKEVNAGQEVVDSKLADAARAVSALGDMDMKSLLEQLQKGELEALLSKLADAEKRQKKLEKQLAQAGVAIAEDIDYGEAKVKVEQIAKRMGEIGGSDVVHPDKEEQNKLREEYFKLEQEMERYNTALVLSEEYQAEQDRLEKKWEDDNAAENLEALKKIRRHMPVKIRHMSEADLTNTPSPNGKFLLKAIAKKFKRTNVLQAIRLNPDDLERMHPSTLENMRVTGLTLTERRALYWHLKCLGPKWEKNKAEKMSERKWTWYQMMKNNFKENLAPYNRHVAQYGPPGNHVGCPLLGKQCPIKADKLIDYDNDYGWPDTAEYEVSDVKKADVDDPGAKAKQEALELAKEKKANERADLLKKHYKGKLLQVSKANGSCEAMDESMDKMEFGLEAWIEMKLDKEGKLTDADKKKEVANFTEGLNTLKLAVLDLAQRSGMQTSGKKKAGGDAEDIRSSVEATLADEVWECSQVYFKYITDRMKEIDMKDTRVEKTIELLENMLGELHTKNESLLKKLGTERKERSRELKQAEKIKKEIIEKIKAKKEAENPQMEEDTPGPGPGGPPGRGGGGRGGMLDAIQGGRGRGGGRGGLLDAISGGRGRGRGRGGGGGRGGLLDAIAGAKGRGRGGGDDGGRGGLMAAIAGRGAGRGRGGGDGGRGGLMAAIAARGAGRGGGGGDAGRGGLMAAIAARGRGG